MTTNEIDAERFWSRVVLSHETDCWNWSGSMTHDYAYLWLIGRGKPVRAHRWAFERYRECIPDGLVCDHLCRNRGCVNPWHIEIVTLAENKRRGIHLGWKKGVTHCLNGHPYDEENTYITPRGKRDCRACRKEASLRSKAKKRMEALA